MLSHRQSRLCALVPLALSLAIRLYPSPASAQTNERSPGEEGSSEPNYALAAVGVLGANVAVNVIDRFVFDEDFAKTSLPSMRANLGTAWVYDSDSFATNEIAHPIHGGIYFSACRTSGLGFWESITGTLAGSATWELFGEVEKPSINDLVSTTLGGIIIGESFHALSRDLLRNRLPVRMVGNPTQVLGDALGETRADSGWYSPLAASLGFGLSRSIFDISELRNLDVDSEQSNGFIAAAFVRGDPFDAAADSPRGLFSGSDGAIPFGYFALRGSVGFTPSSLGIDFFSQGSLGSIALVDEGTRKLCLGASLHYDFVLSDLVKLSANSVGLSLESAKGFKGGGMWTSEFHLSAVAMSANENVFVASVDSSDTAIRNYDFGLGESSKVYLSYAHPRIGAFRIDYCFYGLHSIPGTAISAAAFQYAMVGIFGFSYERMIAKHAAMGLAVKVYHKDAFYSSAADMHESIFESGLYLKAL
jgi:hypothetical protein